MARRGKAPLDHRGFKSSLHQPTTLSADSEDRQWWTKSGIEAAQAVSTILDTLRGYQSERMTQYTLSARLYGNVSMLAGFGMNRSRVGNSRASSGDRISFNMVQSNIDTLQSKLGKSKARPFFLTDGGNYHQRRRAKKLTKMNDGIFYECDTYAKIRDMLRDGMIFGDGFIKVMASDDGKVVHERVLPHEVWIDQIEGIYDRPHQLHHIKHVDRLTLLARYPDARKEILEASGPEEWTTGSRPNASDMVEVRESWHLPSGPYANDGKWVVTVEGHALTPMRPWKHDFFPFAHYRWCKRVDGWFGQGLAEQLQNRQIALNKLDWVMDRSFHMMGSFKILVPAGSRVNTEHIGTNEIGAMVEWSGAAKPEYVTPPAISEQLPRYREQVKEDTYAQSGLSQLSASSIKPAGLDSGAAQRTYHEIESERFQQQGLVLEDVSLQLARLNIATVRDILSGDAGVDVPKGYRVRVPSARGVISHIDWKDVDMPDDSYVMQCFTVSALPLSPAGRQQQIDDFAKRGWYSPREAKRLILYPDNQQTDTLQEVAEEYLLKSYDAVVDDGAPFIPESDDDLQLSLELGIAYLQEAKTYGLDEDRQQLLRNAIEETKRLIQISMTPTPNVAGPIPGAAPVQGAAPPNQPAQSPTGNVTPLPSAA